MNSCKESYEIFIERKINKEIVLSDSCLQSTWQQVPSASAVCPPVTTVCIMIDTEGAIINANNK
jgi:hypothetical protein